MKNGLKDEDLEAVNGGASSWHTHNGVDIDEPDRPAGSALPEFVDSDDYIEKETYETAHKYTGSL